jgi:LysM repeat protein
MRRQIFLWMGLIVLFLSFSLSHECFASEYKVRRGDTLVKISKKFGVSTQALREANDIQGSAIKPKQILIIPESAKTRKSQSVKLSSYVVKKGDSIYNISKKTGVSVSQIRNINHLRSSRLKTGQHLTLSKPAARKEVAKTEEEKLETVDMSLLAEGEDLEEDEAGTPGDDDQASVERDKEQTAALLGKWNSPDERRLFVRVAMGFLGAPYRFGGSSVRGLDCSAFVKKIYELFNVSLPRTAREQSRVGKRVARNELEEGDLVFFNTRRRALGHVGIYIGNNEFVHAASGRSKAVKIDTLDKPYYDTHFIKAVRLKSLDDGA